MSGKKRITNNTKLSADSTVEFWFQLRQNLGLFGTPTEWNGHWEKAWEIFEHRLNERYFDPVERILSGRGARGEGFSVMTLLCILVEFLQAFHEGKVYRVKAEANLRHFEYQNSRGLFRDFLMDSHEFQGLFEEAEAKAFYDDVRCGLLHEARTKGNWIIRKQSGQQLLEKRDGNRILNRTAFYDRVKLWIRRYNEDLKCNHLLRTNFIRKMDDICDKKHVLYFAYGSNIDRKQMADRTTDTVVHCVHHAILDGYRLCFNKRSANETAKANIVGSLEKDRVYGLLYELDDNGWDQLVRFEAGYEAKEVQISLGSKEPVKTWANVFIAKAPAEGLKPSRDYVDLILSAMIQEGFPEDYVSQVRTQTMK